MSGAVLAVLVLVLLALLPSPVAGFDGDFGDPGWIPEPPAWEAPVWEPPVWEAPASEAPVWEPPAWDPAAWEPAAWEPAAWEPAWEPPSWSEPVPDGEPSVWFAPAPDPAPAWEPAPVDYYAPEPSPEPAGLYLVNEVYVRDTVVVDGPLTTYATVTAPETPGTYARELGSVATGDASVYDDVSVNGRLHLSDGRPVAGAYYETFIRTEAGFVSVGITFFQDDAELARLARIDPREVGGTSAGLAGAAGGSPAPAPAGHAVASMPGGGAQPEPAPDESGSARVPDIRTGVVTASGLSAGASIEALRGRQVALHPLALVDGTPATTLTWRALPGPAIAARLSGAGGEPFVARWDRLPPPGATWPLHLTLAVRDQHGTVREAEASVAVRVLAPALAL